jgi:nicotinate-nucleotide adenylyltransferase
MLALAVAGQPPFHVEELEKERPGPSYTVDTLTELHRRRPADEFFLVIGSDTLLDLPHWREPRRILEIAGLLVVVRPGSPLVETADLRGRLGLPPNSPLRLEAVDAPLIDIASHDLRRRAAEGRSLRYLTPRAVEAYIADKRLYRNAGASEPRP